MNIGMLWFDDDPCTALTVKVERAADYYRHKYGRLPDICLVNPCMLAGSNSSLHKGSVGQVAVRPDRAVLPSHLWIGEEERQ